MIPQYFVGVNPGIVIDGVNGEPGQCIVLNGLAEFAEAAGVGVTITNSSYIVIDNVIAGGGNGGVVIDNSSFISVVNSDITDGISIGNSNNVCLDSNQISDVVGEAIIVDASNFVAIQNNTIDSINGSGIVANANTSNIVISDNSISNAILTADGAAIAVAGTSSFVLNNSLNVAGSTNLAVISISGPAEVCGNDIAPTNMTNVLINESGFSVSGQVLACNTGTVVSSNPSPLATVWVDGFQLG